MTGLVALVAALTGIWLLAEYGHERDLERANAAGVRGDYRTALREARRARSGTTTSGRADAVAAYALLRLGRLAEASRSFAGAVDSDPTDWRLRRDWAQTLFVLGDRGGARAQLVRALALNPRLGVPPMFTVVPGAPAPHRGGPRTPRR